MIRRNRRIELQQSFLSAGGEPDGPGQGASLRQRASPSAPAGAERKRARAAARELQQRAVLRDEHVGARGERGLEEDLVVGVTAARQAGALGGGQLVLDAPREPARLRKRGGLRGGGDAVAAEVVGED